jgi:hypothetical protein
MRQVHLSDLLNLVDHMRSFTKADRKSEISKIFDQAHAADKYRKRFGKAHQLWGDGSLNMLFYVSRNHILKTHDCLDDISILKDVFEAFCDRNVNFK